MEEGLYKRQRDKYQKPQRATGYIEQAESNEIKQ